MVGTNILPCPTLSCLVLSCPAKWNWEILPEVWGPPKEMKTPWIYATSKFRWCYSKTVTNCLYFKNWILQTGALVTKSYFSENHVGSYTILQKLIKKYHIAEFSPKWNFFCLKKYFIIHFGEFLLNATKIFFEVMCDILTQKIWLYGLFGYVSFGYVTFSPWWMSASINLVWELDLHIVVCHHLLHLVTLGPNHKTST